MYSFIVRLYDSFAGRVDRSDGYDVSSLGGLSSERDFSNLSLTFRQSERDFESETELFLHLQPIP